LPVKERWADSVRNFALVPIYPMREDVYIGDLRLYRIESDPFSLNSRSLGSVDLARVVAEREGSRPTFPSSSASFPTEESDKAPAEESDKAASKPWRQPTGSLVADGEPANRLRLAALPGLEMVRASTAELGASGITGLWRFIVGGRVDSQQTVILSLRGIETLELPDTVAATRFREHLEEGMNRGLIDTDDDGKPEEGDDGKPEEHFLLGVCAAADRLGDPTMENVRIAMVTRVFYARAINYSFGDTFGAAIRAAAGETIPDLAAANGEDNAETGTGAAARPTPPEVDLGAFESGTPGITARASHVSSDGLSLTEVYEKPLAFGADVLVLSPAATVELLADDCESLMRGGARSD